MFQQDDNISSITMGCLGLENLKDGFISLLNSAQPQILPEFVSWVEVKLVEYKITGHLYPVPKKFYSKTFEEQKQMQHTQYSSYKAYEAQYSKEIKTLKTLISKDENIQSSVIPSVTTSHSLNLSTHAQSNSALAKLLADSKTSPIVGSKLTSHKIPSVPSSPYHNLTISNQDSPPGSTTITTAIKSDSYSALRSLLQSSARVNLTDEFENKNNSDVERNSTNSDVENIPGEQSDVAHKNHQGKHDCALCGKSFVHRSSFRRHMKTIHQGEVAHTCAVCHRRFARREHFVRHKCGEYNPTSEEHDINKGMENDLPFHNTDDNLILNHQVDNEAPSSSIDMSSKWSDISSVSSSGQPSPQYCTENRRKKSAPRKVISEAMHAHNEDYLSDLDESIYEGVKTESGVLDFSMKGSSSRLAIDQLPDLSKPAILSETILDLGRKMDDCVQDSEKCLTPVQINGDQHPLLTNNSMAKVMQNNSPAASPPAGFRIGDLIEHAVSKYHPMMHPSDPKLKSHFDRLSKEFTANNLSPGTAAYDRELLYSICDEATRHTMSAGMKTECVNDVNSSTKKCKRLKQEFISKYDELNASLVDIKPNGENSNFLATNTGTYQITTEDVDSDNPAEDGGSGVGGVPNKVIKVVKQGNYLKLKKEALVIDGELRFICPHCNKVFHRSSNFSRHMRIHRGVFSYICSACNRGFYRKEHFDKHKCYRKAMATTWERKTRVEMDKEDDVERVEDGSAGEEAMDVTTQLSSHIQQNNTNDQSVTTTSSSAHMTSSSHVAEDSSPYSTTSVIASPNRMHSDDKVLQSVEHMSGDTYVDKTQGCVLNEYDTDKDYEDMSRFRDLQKLNRKVLV